MKAKEYRIKVSTYRRTLVLIVWGWKKYFNEEFWDLWYEYDLTTGFYYFDKKANCNVIWMYDYDISTLVHELMHCTLEMLDQVWEKAEGEPPAYIYEELFTNIWMQCWDKFKLAEDVKKFYTK